MSRTTVILATLGVGLVCTWASGATIALRDTISPTDSVTIDVGTNPTGSFTVNIDVSDVTDMTGLDCRLNSLDGSSQFSIIGRTMVSTVVSDPTATDAQVVSSGDAAGTAPGPDNALNPINDRNLGATSQEPDVGITGSDTIMTLTIAYTGLVPGNSYRLRVTGNNDTGLLAPKWGDVNFNVNGFTTILDYTVNATGGGGGGSTLLSAVSRRKHGAGSSYDISCPLVAPFGVEPRQAGSAAAMVLTFDNPPQAVSEPLDCSAVTVTNGTCTSVAVEGNDLVVNLGGLTKNKCLTVSASGIQLDASSPTSVSVVLREGDVNSNGTVNILDLQAVKNQLNQALSQSNFKNDVNVNGTINILDLQVIKNNLNQPASCP